MIKETIPPADWDKHDYNNFSRRQKARLRKAIKAGQTTVEEKKSATQRPTHPIGWCFTPYTVIGNIHQNGDLLK